MEIYIIFPRKLLTINIQFLLADMVAHTPIIPVLRRLRQDDLKFKGSLSCIT
jgi:hypothetical protein